MQRVAKFEKVSKERFLQDWCETFPEMVRSEVERIYEELKLPRRATTQSAGYDFFLPDALHLQAGECVKIPTGIRVSIEEGWVLKLYPRSGLGFKYRLQLNNTVGVIDGDYYYSDNEGHIFAKITNDSREAKHITLAAGEGFLQGIFIEYGITQDDDTVGIRNGGFGSTG